MSYKIYIRMKNNAIEAIIDTRVTVSIITNKLAKKLELVIDKPSHLIIITANRSCVRVLGQITNARVTIQTIFISVELQVIESP